ncbi:MAG TPA: helix-turn-helix domain-containing protein [Candidatus Baltobacteraceae bacterium]|jgi:hypothetical protein|nr:helix-turn-helix domain-containing protein [Candidatus Baltobacteraceae bacterium]
MPKRSESDGLRLFGAPARSRALLAIALLEQTYLRELSRIAGVSFQSIVRIVDDLQEQGVVSTLMRGPQRIVTLNPSFFAYREVRDLLLRLAPTEPRMVKTIEDLRRRPRRRTKEV